MRAILVLAIVPVLIGAVAWLATREARSASLGAAVGLPSGAGGVSPGCGGHKQGHHREKALALLNLGYALRYAGRHEEAIARYREARAILKETLAMRRHIGDPGADQTERLLGQLTD